jgi:L-seryl-tRNA(Ser) seleniumtransferase
MFFMNVAEPNGRISVTEWLELAHRHKVPTLLDAAADVPPLERLSGYVRMGFDLVAFSGGKAICGPNNTGFLLGNKALIDAAKLNTNPHCGTIGRMMKVSKEDMVALLAAVERFVKLDHRAEERNLEHRIEVIETTLKGVPTLQCERIVPAIANHVPHLILSWDEKRLGRTRAQVTQALAEGTPPIRIGRVSGTGDKGILISVLTLQPGEEQMVAERLLEILSKPGEKKGR